MTKIFPRHNAQEAFRTGSSEFVGTGFRNCFQANMPEAICACVKYETLFQVRDRGGKEGKTTSLGEVDRVFDVSKHYRKPLISKNAKRSIH